MTKKLVKRHSFHKKIYYPYSIDKTPVMENSISNDLKKGQFDAVDLMANNQFKAFIINLNAQHVNGMTHFDLVVHGGKLYDC